jgi:hypothetical protein
MDYIPLPWGLLLIPARSYTQLMAILQKDIQYLFYSMVTRYSILRIVEIRLVRSQTREAPASLPRHFAGPQSSNYPSPCLVVTKVPDIVFNFFPRQLPKVKSSHTTEPDKLTTLWALLKRRDRDLSIGSGPASGGNQVGQGRFGFLPATGLETTVL